MGAATAGIGGNGGDAVEGEDDDEEALMLFWVSPLVVTRERYPTWSRRTPEMQPTAALVSALAPASGERVVHEVRGDRVGGAHLCSVASVHGARLDEKHGMGEGARGLLGEGERDEWIPGCADDQRGLQPWRLRRVRCDVCER